MGCQAYVAKHPAIRPKPPPTEVASKPGRGERGEQRRSDRGEQPQQQAAQDDGIPSIPVLGFGPFAPNTSAEGCNETVPDKWAFGTCTLLKASQPKQTAPSAEGVMHCSAAAHCSAGAVQLHTFVCRAPRQTRLLLLATLCRCWMGVWLAGTSGASGMRRPERTRVCSMRCYARPGIVPRVHAGQTRSSNDCANPAGQW